MLIADNNIPQTGVMLLSEIVSEICKRANDPFEDNYKERARELFVAAVYQSYKEPKYTKFDYHGLVGTRNFSTGSEDKRNYVVLGIDNEISTGKLKRHVMEIIDIVSQSVSEASSATRKFVFIDISEANRIATDVELEPIIGEVYWYIAGNQLYLHPNPKENMKQLNFIIEYLLSPLDFKIDENMLDFYSALYIYDSIDVATGKLLAEIGLS